MVDKYSKMDYSKMDCYSRRYCSGAASIGRRVSGAEELKGKQTSITSKEQNSASFGKTILVLLWKAGNE